MAAPLLPLLKKAAVALVTDKRVRKIVVGIVLGVIFLAVLPIIAVLGIFTGGLDLGFDDINELLEQQRAMGELTMQKIEERMQEEGYSGQRIEEAQALFVLALFDCGGDDGFVEKYVECFEPEQTDEQLIAAVNGKFGTTVAAQEFADTVREIRGRYAEKGIEEEHPSG